ASPAMAGNRGLGSRKAAWSRSGRCLGMRRSRVRETTTLFFLEEPAPTEICTLSLHDALPISARRRCARACWRAPYRRAPGCRLGDRKSTRLNSSHSQISYAVFCLKKKSSTGGGSDGNFTATLRVPTLDGFGAVDDCAHPLHQH